MIRNRQSAQWLAAHAPPSARRLPAAPSTVTWNPFGDPFIPALSGLLTSMADGTVAVLPSAGSPYAGDDANFINAAYNYSPIVQLVPGLTYSTQSPVILPGKGCKLRGGTGAMQGGAGSPNASATIQPAASWAAGGGSTAIVQLGAAARQSVEDVWIYGVNLVPASIDGINATGNGHNVARVGVNNCTGLGINAVSGLGFLGEDIVIQNCTGGGYYCGVTDAAHINVHAQNNKAVQIQLNSGDNRAIGCRADGDGVSGSTHGYVLNAFNGTSALGLGCILTACSTGGNLQNGVLAEGGGHTTYGPYKLTGCSFTGDGGGGTFAAIEAIGRIVLEITDCDVSLDSTGTFPAYGLQTDQNSGSHAVPDLVTVTGGVWQAATAFINDLGPATAHQISGTFGVLGAINGTTGTTTFASFPW